MQSRNIKTFRVGNPVDFGKSELPMIYVQPLEERTTQLDNATDVKEMDFQIGVIIDPASEYGRSDKGKKESPGDRLLMEITDGRNDDGTTKTDTIAYLLRHGWTLSGTIFYQEHRVVYGVREAADTYYKEVHFMITAKSSVART